MANPINISGRQIVHYCFNSYMHLKVSNQNEKFCISGLIGSLNRLKGESIKISRRCYPLSNRNLLGSKSGKLESLEKSIK